jgi:hypothetical protein
VHSRFLRSLVAVLTLSLVCAASAAAASLTFDGEVLRYRAQPEEGPEVRLLVDQVFEEFGGAPKSYLQIATSGRVDMVVGCAVSMGDAGWQGVRCPLGPLAPGQVRYRLSFEGRNRLQTSGTDDEVYDSGVFPGVIYAGPGNDLVRAGDRVYGGTGNDDLNGARVHGGPGADHVSGDVDSYTARPVVLRGGQGNDVLTGPGHPTGGSGHLYGGRGDDVLNARAHPPSREMLVGGPGSDVINLYFDPDYRRDVVRVRGGGVDRVRCRPNADPGDTLFVDATDRLSPSCKNARVLLTGRPRYPYP